MGRYFGLKRPSKPFGILALLAMALLIYFCYDTINHYLTQPQMVAAVCDGAKNTFNVTDKNYLTYILGGGTLAPVIYFGFPTGLLEAGLLFLAYIACVILMFHSNVFYKGAKFAVGFVILFMSFWFVVTVIPVIALIVWTIVRDMCAKISDSAWNAFDAVEHYVGKSLMIALLGFLMAVFMLAAGGKYIPITKQVLASVYSSEMWYAIGGFFSLMVLPGFAVSYAAVHNRIVGAAMFVFMIVLGFISGISWWWILTAVMILLSFAFFLNENVGEYDVMDGTDKICVLFPLAGAFRFVDKLGLKGLFSALCKILAVLSALVSIVVPLLTAFVKVKDDSSFMASLTSFSQSLTGVLIIEVFMPMFAVLTFAAVFAKPGLAKVVSILACGLNVYRGAHLVMIASVTKATDVVTGSTTSEFFGNIFGTNFSVLIALTIGSVICIYLAFKKNCTNLWFNFTLDSPGAEACNAMVISAITTGILLMLAPIVMGAAAAVMILAFMLLMLIVLKMVPRTSYQDLRRRGYTHDEAMRTLRLNKFSSMI